MKRLNHCKYPKASDENLHGLQLIQNQLPIAQLPEKENGIAVASELTERQLKEMAKVVAESFALREPMARHLSYVGPLMGTKDGVIMAFIINCLVPKKDIMDQSIALLKNGHVLGGAFNETLVIDTNVEVSSVPKFILPILEFLENQQTDAIPYLVEKVEGFEKAWQARLVGHHFMVARGNEINGDETFELVIETIRHYKKLNFAFVVTEATNAWTGAAFEALGGVRVHFMPYRSKIIPGISSDGYLSDKDSGSMLYILKL